MVSGLSSAISSPPSDSRKRGNRESKLRKSATGSRNINQGISEIANSAASEIKQQGKMVFTVGTFDDNDSHGSMFREHVLQGKEGGGSEDVLSSGSSSPHRQQEIGFISSKQPQQSQPLFTMGSHSEVSDLDVAAAAAYNNNRQLDQSCPAHSPNALHMCKASTGLSKLGNRGVKSQQLNSLAKPEEAAPPTELESTNSPLPSPNPPISPSSSSSSSSSDDNGEEEADSPDELPLPPALNPKSPSEVASPLPANRCRTSMLRDGQQHSKHPRKKVANKKSHLKKTISTAGLRSRGGRNHNAVAAAAATAAAGGPYHKRRDQQLVMRRLTALQTDESNNGSPSSYVDYSGDSDPADDNDENQPPQVASDPPMAAATDPQTPNGPGPDTSRTSLPLSTATLETSIQEDDSTSTVTTASVPSSPQQNISTAFVMTQASSFTQNENEVSSSYRNSNTPITTNLVSEDANNGGGGGSDDRVEMHHTNSDHQLQQGGENGGNLSSQREATKGARRTRSEEPQHTTSPAKGNRNRQGGGMSTNAKRNMESQRQQSMVEQEEEDLEIANSLVTGMPRRSNRPGNMNPQAFLDPNLPAYYQQMRNSERAYGHVREMAHPLLESISRCVTLREQRVAMGAPRSGGNSNSVITGGNSARSWLPRRNQHEQTTGGSGGNNPQSDWWESLMPPRLISSASANAASNIGGASRNGQYQQRVSAATAAQLPPTEIPSWAAEPNEVKCAVYGPEMNDMVGYNTRHDPPHRHHIDPSCLHLQELRAHAMRLRARRRHAINNAKNSANSQQLHQSNDLLHVTIPETWKGRGIPGLTSVDMYSGMMSPTDPSNGHHPRQRSVAGSLVSGSPDSVQMMHNNPVAAPYRRYGTVYGCNANKKPNAAARPVQNSYGRRPGGLAKPGMGLTLNIQGAGGIAAHNAIDQAAASSRPSTAGIWENDPRRSSYFDRLSVDEQARPNQLAASATQTNFPGTLIRRVISGFTNGGTAATAAFGTSH